jgi:hypothetical protein
MLTDRECKILHDFITFTENTITNAGGCDHSAGICWCMAKASIIDGYEILHNNGFGEHNWLKDFVWDDADVLVTVYRCDKCYAEKPLEKV